MHLVLPVISGQRVIRALAKVGFTVEGRKGSHIKLKKKFDGKFMSLLFPNTPKWRKEAFQELIQTLSEEGVKKVAKSCGGEFREKFALRFLFG